MNSPDLLAVLAKLIEHNIFFTYLNQTVTGEQILHVHGHDYMKAHRLYPKLFKQVKSANVKKYGETIYLQNLSGAPDKKEDHDNAQQSREQKKPTDTGTKRTTRKRTKTKV